MSSKSKLNNVKGVRRQERAMAKEMERDAAAGEAFEKQRFGPNGEGADQDASVFDRLPHRYADNLAQQRKNEAFKDIVSLQPYFGGDNIMGQKPFDPALLDYIKGFRQEGVNKAMHDLVLSALDPEDLRQREILEEWAPGIVQSKQQVFDACIDQIEFVNKCAIAARLSRDQLGKLEDMDLFDKTHPSIERLVRILGGSEPLVEHPIINLVSGGNPDPAQAAPSGYASLFNFLFSSRVTQAATQAEAKGRTRRVSIAKAVLRHFPRYMTGGYKPEVNTTIPRVRVAAAAAQLVTACENVCKQLVPLGQVLAQASANANGDTTGVLGNRLNTSGLGSFFGNAGAAPGRPLNF